MSNIADFEIALKDFGEDVIDVHKKICGKIGLDIMSDLTVESPADTGRFRSGWIYTQQTDTDEVPPDYPDKVTGDGRYSGEASKRASEAAINAATLQDFPTVYVQNNVEYGPALNDGHSAQAPAGFVEAAFDRNVSAIPI